MAEEKILFQLWSEATVFEQWGLIVVAFISIAGLLYAAWLIKWMLGQPKGSREMQEISKAIQDGAQAYLNKQLRTVSVIIVILSFALLITAWLADNPMEIVIGRTFAFLMGATFSASIGYIGMSMAVRANVRVAEAAKTSFNKALQIGYRTGTIVGMLTDGLGLLGGTLIFMVYGLHAYEALLGFGFGGTIIALFMRVGGGIFTKAADVGADLVGKVEKDLPEDDPRNAAVIADQVGDNVGDCAGMAADIFESYEVTMVSAMILGIAAFQHVDKDWRYVAVVFPLLVRAIGVFSSIIGTYMVRVKDETEDAMKGINKGYRTSATISIAAFLMLGVFWVSEGRIVSEAPFVVFGNHIGWRMALATFAGVLLAVGINKLTEYYTSVRFRPVKNVAKATRIGPANTILSGLTVGMESAVYSLWVIVAAIVFSCVVFWNVGMAGVDQIFMIAYGVSLCGIGMLTLTGNTISMDTFGPIADNAQGITQFANLDETTKKRVEALDAVGNTTKAITKGIAIGSAVIAATCLFVSFSEEVGLGDNFVVDIVNPIIFVGVLLGGTIPFLFSAMAIRSVEKAAQLIVIEVRRQFREIEGLMEGTAKPDYKRPVEICTNAAQKDLIGLGIIAVISPILVGMLFGEITMGAFLAGSILSAQLLAVFLSNTGGAWDNAKKMVEDGMYGGKGSDAHKAGVIGDTVGDPLKDTAGPAMNPMVKVINLVAVLMAPIIVKYNIRQTWDVNPIPTILAIVLMAGSIVWAIWYSHRE
ncbi:MAG TPA: sodium-translocating pyrophosphatase [Euryarchaeota archaeon]|nr:sodium-translocating pyrophosphatase [Euryarchaeota archaeon]